MPNAKAKKVVSDVRVVTKTQPATSSDILAANFIMQAHSAVRKTFATTIDLPTFRATSAILKPSERLLIVEQALVLLEQNYVHLPLKEAMHAVDPIQKLRLLQRRLSKSSSEVGGLEFHQLVTEIFMSVRDLHTNYILPSPNRYSTAFLPFLIEEFCEGDKRRNLVTRLSEGYDSPPFEAGVEVLSWNGIPISRAVEIEGDRFAGSNREARRARGVATLTVRWLGRSLPPDEDRVIIEYQTADLKAHELRQKWLVFSSPQHPGELKPPEPRDAESEAVLGIDIELEETNRMRKILFAPEAVAEEKRAMRKEATVSAKGALKDLVTSSVMAGRAVDTPSGEFGYIRIRQFMLEYPNDGLSSKLQTQAIVAKFLELSEQLPQQGLIIDVRGNGGGIIMAGERLLQLLTPKVIDPEPVQMINTPLNFSIAKHTAWLQPWVQSMEESLLTGAIYSRGFPITTPEEANDIGQTYHGPVILITDALCYSTTDIFAAGFQDHGIGHILGVDNNTGAGGANVWEHDLLYTLASNIPNTPYNVLPGYSAMRVAMRRCLRVRKNAGMPVEDLGVVPDSRHYMTRTDLLQKNEDLINRAGEILASMPVRELRVKDVNFVEDHTYLTIQTFGITGLDVFVDGRAKGSVEVIDGESQIVTEKRSGSILEMKGFDNDGNLVAARKVSLE